MTPDDPSGRDPRLNGDRATEAAGSAGRAGGPWARPNGAEPTPPDQNEPSDPPPRMTLKGAPVTIALLVICTAIELLVGGDEGVLRAYSVIYLNAAPLATGLSVEGLYRLITHVFLHAGWLHLAFNMAALLVLGPPVERAMGSVGYAVLFVLMGIAGGVAHVGWDAAVAVVAPVETVFLSSLVGASGAICGLLGVELRRRALLLEALPPERRRESPGRFLINASSGFVLVNVLLTLLPTPISGVAHLGGFALGLILAPSFLLKTPPPEPR